MNQWEIGRGNFWIGENKHKTYHTEKVCFKRTTTTVRNSTQGFQIVSTPNFEHPFLGGWNVDIQRS